MQNTILSILLFFIVFQNKAQNPIRQRCGTDEYVQQKTRLDPNYAVQIERVRNRIWNEVGNNNARSSRSGIITIPVIFHVIDSGEAIGTGRNIDSLRIFEQLSILNKDFRRMNSDTGFVPPVFKSIAADVGIEFCLAQHDPNGNRTNGIDRINRPHVFTTYVDFDTAVKHYTYWDPTQYLNIWTTDMGGGLLGYTPLPGAPANEDGVVLDYHYVGLTANPNYNLGRTCTHEIGHWLGLYHTFQNGCVGTDTSNCALFGDYICDTPPESSQSSGCPSPAKNTCTETPTDKPDMWMNYLDYSDDVCMYMFTNGQKAVMQSTLNGVRSSILTSNACKNLHPVTFSGRVYDSLTHAGVPSAIVHLQGTTVYETKTDTNGYFTFNTLYKDTYAVYAGKWGYYTKQYSRGMLIDSSTPAITIQSGYRGYYDDFLMDFGWTVTGDATSGAWTRGIPYGTTYNGKQITPALPIHRRVGYGEKCYLTGNSGGSPFNNNLDTGYTYLLSPMMDLTSNNGYSFPHIDVNIWFYNGGSVSFPPDDTLKLYLSNGTQTVLLDSITDQNGTNNRWSWKSYALPNFIHLTSTMQFRIEAKDGGNHNLYKAAIDYFEVNNALGIKEEGASSLLHLYPNPTNGILNIALDAQEPGAMEVEIRNTIGQQVYAGEEPKHIAQINVSALSAGMYFVEITTATNRFIRKINIAHP